MNTALSNDLEEAGWKLITAAIQYRKGDCATAFALADQGATLAHQTLDAATMCPDCGGLGYVCTYYRAGQMDEPEFGPCPSGCPDTRQALFSCPSDATTTGKVR